MTLKVKHYKELTPDELHDIYRYRVFVFVVEQICPYQEVDDNDKVSCICGWITDSIGIPIQHLQYLPYGEPYIDQRAAGTTYSERFTFTGKEKDSETGYGYFGARYMDHELMTMWLSVDPMADKYPSISPYAYCAWNPVRLVDPDGNEAIDNDDWYKDEKGRLKWDPSVTKETTLKDGEEYLGKTVLLTNSEGQTVYGDEQGRLHTSVHLAEVNITADASTTEMDANIAAPIAVPIGALLLEQLSTAAGVAIEAVATIAWIIPASLLFSGDTRQCATDNGNDDVQTSAGQKTDRYGNVLGGSGKPRVNTVHHPTQKKAKDAARNQGKGRPVKHPSPKVGEPHYHPTDRNGLKKPNSPHHGF